MVKNLAKTPLTAIVFTSLLTLALVLTPFSQGYLEARQALVFPIWAYGITAAYGLWLSITIAIIFSSARRKNIMLILVTLPPLLVSQWFAPMLGQIVFGEVTKVMTQTDTLLKIAGEAVSALFVIVLLFLLRAREEQPATPAPAAAAAAAAKKPEDKYKLLRIRFLIIMVVLPIIYMIIHFLVRYMLLWRNEAVRVYYIGDAEAHTFIESVISMLLTDAKQVPLALIKGFLYAASLITLLFQLEAKRVMFIILSVMLFIGFVAQMLIPSPVMSAQVRMAHILPLVVELVVYAASASFLLHLCIRKTEASATAQQQTPAARSAAAQQNPAARLAVAQAASSKPAAKPK